jgi:hypothetical protein
VPIPQELALELSAAVKHYAGEMVVTDKVGRRFSPWDLQAAFRTSRKEVNGLPEGFGSMTFGTTSPVSPRART